ncbi:MAG: iron-sulfur cluster assembly protein [Candidatus Hydrogenedentota bacterium]
MIDKIIDVLKSVKDKYLNMDIVSARVVRDIGFSDGVVYLTFRPTQYFCPLAIVLTTEIKKKLLEMDEVSDVNFKIEGYYDPERLQKSLAELTER